MSNGSASDVSEKKPPAVLDSDDLIDEILRTKGPAKYKDGLSEENWEEASILKYCGVKLLHSFFLYFRNLNKFLYL